MWERIESAALFIAYLGMGVGCCLIARESFGLAGGALAEVIKEAPVTEQKTAAAK